MGMLSKVEGAVIGMLRDSGKVFYASLLLQMIREEDERCPTMRVSIISGRIYLTFNPKFIEKLTVLETIAILEHECMHLIHGHMYRLKNKERRIFNVAADMAINQFIQGLPKGCIDYKDFNLPEKKCAEYYYEALLKQMPKIQSQGEGEESGYSVETPKGNKQSIDSHDAWKTSTEGVNADLNKEVVRQTIKQAVEQTQKDRGTVPGACELLVKEWLQPPTVPWQSLLKMFIGNSIKADSKRSWKRMSRRFGGEQKGIIPTRILKLVIAIDTSGSINNIDLQNFMVEIKGIQANYKSNITIMECDAAIQKVYELEQTTKVQSEFKGRGGTDFEPVFKELKKRNTNPDLLVFFTDLDCPFPKEPPIYPVLWCVTPEGANKKVPFGMVVRMTESKNKGGSNEDNMFSMW